MSVDLSPAAFLDLTTFAHAALFEGVARCWDALGGPLDDYLTRLIGATGERLRGTIEPGAHVIGDDVVIGAGTVVEAGAYVRGPAIIGRDCEVRHGAYVRGHVLTGDRCVIGHATELKTAIFLDGAKAGHFAYVGDSILGRDVNLGAGTKLANFKLTGDEVAIRVEGERIATGRRKLGAILGDEVQTGCNSVTSPGTLLGRRSFVLPCVSVRAGYYPPGTHLR